MALHESSSMTRRVWARMALWGAVGLSLLPVGWVARSRPRADEEEVRAPPRTAHGSLLTRWRNLGRVWRRWSAAVRAHPRRGDPDTLWEQWNSEQTKLWEETQAALDALPAWPELRVLFEERESYIAHYKMGVQISCYLASGPTYEEVGEAVYRQAEEVEKLVAEGRLTRRVAERAARRLAIQAEYEARSMEAWETVERAQPSALSEGTIAEKGIDADPEPADDERLPTKMPPQPEPDRTEFDKIEEAYRRGKTRPGPLAILAGRRVVELIADDLGWLAGEPTEEEIPEPAEAVIAEPAWHAGEE